MLVLSFASLLLLMGPARSSGVGRCVSGVEPLESFDFNQFSRERGGIWRYAQVPDVLLYEGIEWMFLKTDPIKEEADAYRTTVYYQKKDKEEELQPAVLEDQAWRQLHGSGLVTGEPITGDGDDRYRIVFLAYEPERFTYLYICSDEGHDDNRDYRFVLSHGHLKLKDRLKIWEIDMKYEFKGALKKLFT